jgi:hypothetical protein
MAQPVEYTCPLIDSTIKLISQLSGDENTIQQIIERLLFILLTKKNQTLELINNLNNIITDSAKDRVS